MAGKYLVCSTPHRRLWQVKMDAEWSEMAETLPIFCRELNDEVLEMPAYPQRPVCSATAPTIVNDQPRAPERSRVPSSLMWLGGVLLYGALMLGAVLLGSVMSFGMLVALTLV